jgi:hypothetical protein
MRTFFFAASRGFGHRSPGAKLRRGANAAATFLAVMIPATGSAQQQAESHRVLAQTMNLANDTAANVQAQIWKDIFPDLLKEHDAAEHTTQRKLPLAATVFVASFKDGKRTVILSSIARHCRSVSSVVPYEQTCPARIAVAENGAVHILRNIDDFQMSSGSDPDGPETSQNNYSDYQTVASYNRAKQQLSTVLIDNNESIQGQTFDLQ